MQLQQLQQCYLVSGSFCPLSFIKVESYERVSEAAERASEVVERASEADERAQRQLKEPRRNMEWPKRLLGGPWSQMALKRGVTENK